VGGGVHIGSTRHVGYFWPLVPAPDDCEDGDFGGMEIGREKKKYSDKTCPSVTLSTINPTSPDPGANPARRSGKQASNRLSYGVAVPNLS
jgi:hypothetical protein